MNFHHLDKERLPFVSRTDFIADSTVHVSGKISFKHRNLTSV